MISVPAKSLSTVVLLALLASCTNRPAASRPAAPATLALIDSVDLLDALAREPMVAEHQSGALFVSGYGDTIPHLWRSTDRGRSWNAVNLGTAAAGAAGNSDVDLAVGPDGTVYLITLAFDRTKLEGTNVQVAVSHDTGASWRWTQLSRTRFDDRPWVRVAPNGTAHAIWNDGAGVSHAVSIDSGRTWAERGRVNALGGSSHLAIGPKGEVAVRVVPISASGNRFDAGVDLVAVSTDQGLTWQRHPLPGERAWQPLQDTTVSPPTFAFPAQPRWVEPLAWDASGSLYSFWASGLALWLARSTDQGASWTSWNVAQTDSTPYYPYLIAGQAGELAASWFSGHGDSLKAHVARFSLSVDSSPPRVATAPAWQPESFGNPAFGQPPGRDPAGEYLPLVFLRDGSLGVAAPLQNAAAKRFGFGWRRYQVRP